MRRVSPREVCQLARTYAGVTEKDHFGSDAFSAHGRIFLTVWHDKHRCAIRLSPALQKEFLAMDGEGLHEQDNAWGRQGWVSADLQFLERAKLLAVLAAAYEYSKEKGPKLGAGRAKKSASPARKASRPKAARAAARKSAAKPRKK